MEIKIYGEGVKDLSTNEVNELIRRQIVADHPDWIVTCDDKIVTTQTKPESERRRALHELQAAKLGFGAVASRTDLDRMMTSDLA